MNVLIVGVGLIGGSFAMALKNRKDIVFAGHDTNEAAVVKALEIGFIDRCFNDFNEGVEWCDVIILAIPVGIIKKVLPGVLDGMRQGQVVVDFGSTKESICRSVLDHPKRAQYIAAHPIAGTEHSGPSAAFAELYKDRNLILCDTELSDPALLAGFEELAKEAGFYLTKMNSSEHDRHLAYISHLSHVTSYVLSHTVLTKEKDGEVILELAGSGFESTVRLAKSSPSMWCSIFLENKEMVLNGIKAYRQELDKLESLIENESAELIEAYLREGREIRKILK